MLSASLIPRPGRGLGTRLAVSVHVGAHVLQSVLMVHMECITTTGTYIIVAFVTVCDIHIIKGFHMTSCF